MEVCVIHVTVVHGENLASLHNTRAAPGNLNGHRAVLVGLFKDQWRSNDQMFGGESVWLGAGTLVVRRRQPVLQFHHSGTHTTVAMSLMFFIARLS